MIALGLADRQIGIVLSISWIFQVVLALLGGAVTDKMGRRRTTLVFDILSWAIPALISAVAQNFWYFVAAGIVNSLWRITHNSWTCLLVEDADPSQLVDIYTWIHIANLLVGFVAPLTGLLIRNFTLVPTLRGLYIFAAFMFTLKAIITYWITDETAQGKVRMQETQGQSIINILGEYKGVLNEVLRAPQTLYAAGIMLVISVSNLISGSFWAIIVTEKLHIPAENIAIFPFIKTAIMVMFFFVIMPRINKLHFKIPMVIGFITLVASQMVLINAPELGYSSLIMSVFLEACSLAAINPLVDQMMVLSISAKERARIQSILTVGIILLTAPFGWIAGTLSESNKDFPFILNSVLFLVGSMLVLIMGAKKGCADKTDGIYPRKVS
jgi:MFS family permease